MRDVKGYSSKALKGRNLAWLVATLILDFLVLLVMAFHINVDDLLPAKITVIRASLTALLPIPAMIFSSLISANLKATLVFWRHKYPLPGSRAFSVYAQADHRIDLAQLKKNVGDFPISERDQNSKWYKLYKQVDSDPSVFNSHTNYLLFRDIAAMSLLLVLVLPIVMYFIGINLSPIEVSITWFLGQYLLTAFAARNAGIRLVQSVLAVHASRKVTGTRATKKAS